MLKLTVDLAINTTTSSNIRMYARKIASTTEAVFSGMMKGIITNMYRPT
jgi:predicted transglutaminase-like protease